MSRSFMRCALLQRIRFNLHHAGVGLLIVSGVLVASTLLTPAPNGKLWRFEIFLNLAITFFGALVAMLFMNAARREAAAVRLFDWLRELDNLLGDLSSPLNSEKLYPTGAWIAELLSGNTGWVMLMRAPGLLIRGEVKRRRYLPVVSKNLKGRWSISLAETFIRNLMEGEHQEPGAILSVPDKNGDKRPLFCWSSRSQSGDISAGMAIALPMGRWCIDNLISQALTTALGMVVQRMGNILMEVIERREGLGVENLGLVMRVLVHELNNDLQGAVNTMDAYEEAWSEKYPASAMNMRRLLTRAGYWTSLMREAPFLVDDVLPFERNVVCLSDLLRETLDEVQKAWPDVFFVHEMDDDIHVVGDHHLRSVLRNLLHNAASYTKEQVKVEVRVEPERKIINLLVLDEGPGVDPADVDKIFAPLSSMREGRAMGPRVTYGMGVGLTISRAIARAYGGELLCHSNQEGKGGVFEVILPTAELADEGEETYFAS